MNPEDQRKSCEDLGDITDRRVEGVRDPMIQLDRLLRAAGIFDRERRFQDDDRGRQ